jgi:hypothetical protein
MSSIREQYLRDHGGYEDIAAIAFAKDLMRGDPATFKAGYTKENAVIAAQEIFPNAIEVDFEKELVDA